MQYVVMKDEETGEVDVLGRFDKGIDEVLIDGKWESNGLLYSLQFDGLLEEISETEAKKLIAKQSQQPQLQAA